MDIKPQHLNTEVLNSISGGKNILFLLCYVVQNAFNNLYPFFFCFYTTCETVPPSKKKKKRRVSEFF